MEGLIYKFMISINSVRVPFAPYPYQQLELSDFVVLAELFSFNLHSDY